LIKHEVIPVVGELAKPETYQEALDKSTFIIDNVIDFTAKEPFTSNKALLDATVKSAAALQVTKTYIYTSGILVYTHSAEEVRDENSPLPGDHPVFKGRIAFEREVLDHTGVRGIVIRPGYVYGGSSGAGNHLSEFFAKAKQDKIVIPSKYILSIYVSVLIL